MERTFGVYRLGETLATLPFGELAAATHPARSEALAVLLLDARLSSDHRFRGLVRLEMARAGGLRQPGIARVVEVGEQSGALAVVYERPAESASLAARLTEAAPIGQDAALGLVRQLAAVLDTAHGRRIVHGLLGPDAVLIGPDLTPAVVGIGLLTAVEEAGLRDAVLEQADAAFLAPEQSAGKLAVASADGYALAVLAERVLDETSAGRAVLRRQQSANVSDRFPSCTAFADALTAALGRTEDTVAPSPAKGTPGVAPSAGPVPSTAPSWTPPPPTWTTPPSSAPTWTSPVQLTATIEPAEFSRVEQQSGTAQPAEHEDQAVAIAPPMLSPDTAVPAITPTSDEPPPAAADELATPLSPDTRPPSVSDAPPAYSPPTYEPPPWAVPPAPAVEPPAAAPPATSPPVDARPAASLPAASLPAASLPAASLPAASLPAAPPPATPPPGYAAPPAADPRAPGSLPGWLRDTIDPPRPAGQPAAPPRPSFGRPAGSTTSPPQERATAWRAGDWIPPNSVRLPPTPAMLACLRAVERTDILTTAVLAVVDQVPALQPPVERHAPDGRIGPVPLGAAVAGVLSLLLLLLNLPALAGIVVVLVMGVYVLPPLLKKLTAGEQPPVEAIRATGDMSIRAREVGPQWSVYELEIGDGAPLTVTAAGYRRLTAIGRPVTVERQGPHGPEVATVAHELPGLTVTYLMPSRLLLDVRDADGTVIHRHPEYAGEPGDRANIAAAADVPGRPRRSASVEQPDAVPTWKPTARGYRLVQRTPPLLTSELQAAFKDAAIRAGLLNAVPVIILLASIATNDFGFFAFMIALGLFFFVGVGQLTRAIQLWTARQAGAIVRVAGQLRLRQVRRSGSKGRTSDHHFLILDDGKELKIAGGLFGRLRQVGRPLNMGEGPSLWERFTQSEEVIGVYEADGLAVTYEPSSDMLLEVVDTAGTTYYRDSAVSPQGLGEPPPLPGTA